MDLPCRVEGSRPREQGLGPLWDFPKIGVPYLGVLIMGSYY